MSFNLIRNIVSQTWAIDPAYVQGILPWLGNLLSGNIQEIWPKEAPAPTAFAIMQDGPMAMSYNDEAIKPGSVAIINLRGVMMKNDQFCGPRGTASIAAELSEYAKNPNIIGAVLKADTPGGTVDGTEELARVVATFGKPIVAFVDGITASAGYWPASATNHIFLSGKTSAVGSIGTRMDWASLRPALEKQGIVFHSVKATRSIDKNSIFEQADQGKYDGLRSEWIDPVNDVFTNAVETNRAGKLNLKKEDVLTGKMYIGQAAINAGLADSIGTMDDAVAWVQNQSKKTKKTSMKLSEKYPGLSAVALFAENAEAMENGGVEMSAEEMARVEASLVAAGSLAANIEDMQANLQARADELAALQNTAAELVTANDRIIALQAEVEALGKGTGAPADTSKPEDPGKPARKKAKYAHELLAEELGL